MIQTLKPPCTQSGRKNLDIPVIAVKETYYLSPDWYAVRNSSGATRNTFPVAAGKQPPVIIAKPFPVAVFINLPATSL